MELTSKFKANELKTRYVLFFRLHLKEGKAFYDEFSNKPGKSHINPAHLAPAQKLI